MTAVMLLTQGGMGVPPAVGGECQRPNRKTPLSA
jgi:hypothetical protein